MRCGLGLMRPWLVSLALALSAIDWSADLDFLQRELPNTHPNAFHAVSREAWEATIAKLRDRASSMPPAAVAVEISRIVAMIGDGHTRLTLPVDPNAGFFAGHTPTPMPSDPALHFHQFPVRFFWYDDGLYVRAATRTELVRSEEHTSELQSLRHLVCRLLLEKKKKNI